VLRVSAGKSGGGGGEWEVSSVQDVVVLTCQVRGKYEITGRPCSTIARKLEPSVSKVFPHLQVSSPPLQGMYTLGWIRGGERFCSLQCVRALPECPEGTVNLAGYEPHVSHKARQ
jgi:hypothetical protein